MVKLDQDFGAAFAGVLTDDAGAVRALWGSYSEQACHPCINAQLAWSSRVPAKQGHYMHRRSSQQTSDASSWTCLLQRLSRQTIAGRSCEREDTLTPRAAPQGTDKEDREWCAGLPVAVAAPWIDRLRLSFGPGGSTEGPSGDAPMAGGGPTAEGGAEGGHAAAPAALAVRVLDAELEALTMSKAAAYGLPEAWVARLTRFDPVRRQARCRHTGRPVT